MIINSFSFPPQHDMNFLILAPLGQDAILASKVLEDVEIGSEIMKNVSELCMRLCRPAGGILITEESITNEGLEVLFKVLNEQESWSDIPLILITSAKERFVRTKLIVDRFGPAGNISILERPFSKVTLITSAKVAIRSRKKQYQIKGLISALNVQIRSKDEFMSVASHELKTPLTALKLNIQVKKRALEKGDGNLSRTELLEAYLKASEKQVERLIRLVDDMLDITRIKNNKLSLLKTNCEISEITSQVFNNFSAMVKVAGRDMRLVIKNKVNGKWDRFRLEQVITNLISNAIKYGEVSPILVTVYEENDQAAVDVEDNGPGISLENQKKIFQKFERAEADSHVTGLGLGLYISQQIAEQHGGELSVESELGKGARFKLRLPKQYD